MRTGIMAFCILVGTALGARAEPYWIAYDGNDFPENEGWERTFSDPNGIVGQGGAIRTIDNGALVLDSRASLKVVDFYEVSRPIDPEPGETFVMRWRMRIDSVPSLPDPGIGVFTDGLAAVALEFTESEVSSPLEAGLSLAIAPQQYHAFELRSTNMLEYDLWVDGALAWAGVFTPVFEASRMTWGDGVQGATSLVRWDYVEFGVVPEPSSAVTLVLGGCAAVGLTARRRRL